MVRQRNWLTVPWVGLLALMHILGLVAAICLNQQADYEVPRNASVWQFLYTC